MVGSGTSPGWYPLAGPVAPWAPTLLVWWLANWISARWEAPSVVGWETTSPSSAQNVFQPLHTVTYGPRYLIIGLRIPTVLLNPLRAMFVAGSSASALSARRTPSR